MVRDNEDFDAYTSSPSSENPDSALELELERQVGALRRSNFIPVARPEIRDEAVEEVPVETPVTSTELVVDEPVPPVVEELVTPVVDDVVTDVQGRIVHPVEVPEIELPDGFTLVETETLIATASGDDVAAPGPLRRDRSRRAAKPASTKPPKVKRGSSAPSTSKPAMSGKRRSAQVLSFLAMGFVVAIAIATSVPANALLSAKDVALLNEADQVGNTDTWNANAQSVDVSGTEETTVTRDGVSVSSQAVITAGDFLNRVAVNVPESKNPIVWPFADVQISSNFGWRGAIGYVGSSGADNFHTGLDMDPKYGTPIFAVADGIVTLTSGAGGPIGVTVMIEHNVKGNKFASVYGHMAVGSVTVQNGQSVKAGDVIGAVGNTGYSTGPHLHLEIRPGSQPVDPFAFLMQYAGPPKSLKYDAS